NPTMLQARPLCGHAWDTYTFTDPLKDIHGITLRFRNPDAPLAFLPDTLYNVSFASAGGAPGPYIVATEANHGLAVGDRIFIEKFASGSSVLDRYINRSEGHVVAGDPGLPALPPGTPLAAVSLPDTFWLDPAVGTADLTPAPVLPQIA